jgi:uncharacterized protein (DUF169 family)
MDMALKEQFMRLWEKYFPGSALPVIFYYTSDDPKAGRVKPPASPEDHRCMLADLNRARNGRPLYFDADSFGCSGGKRYSGFTRELRPHFEYFLSYGIPGELEGERYKKSPEIVKEVVRNLPEFEAPGKYIVFKRWDKFTEEDKPDVVIFFSPPDVLSGLFTLANYDEVEPNGVFAPFAAGCSTIVLHPYLEKVSGRPRAVLGMFDVSARPCVPSDVLSFAVPWPKFLRMVDNMEESFLTTASWAKVRRRIQRTK